MCLSIFFMIMELDRLAKKCPFSEGLKLGQIDLTYIVQTNTKSQSYEP